MEYNDPTPIRIGTWVADPLANQLSRRGKTIRVTPKVMHVLLCLARRPGEPVTRDAFFDEVWRGTVVGEDVLNRAISDLRKVFDDDPNAPRFIETLPKVGYRLIAPVDYPPARPYAAAPAITINGDGMHAAAPSKRSAPVFWSLLLLVLLAGLAVWQGRGTAGLDAPRPPLQPRPLTAFPNPEIQPALSPDGNQVAFAWQGETGENWDIYVKLIGSETVLRLTTDAASDLSPAWSPQGDQVAFVRKDDDTCGIMVVPALGGSARKLADCGPNTRALLAWSPDGTWLAITDKLAPDESFSLFLVSTQTGERRRLTASQSQHWGDYGAVFSPDGARVAYTTAVSMTALQLNLIDVDGNAPPRRLWEGQSLTGLTWSSDGQALVFASDQADARGLWRLPLGKGEPVWLGVASFRPSRPVLSRDGTRLVYEEYVTSTRIQQARLGADSVAVQPWLASTRSDLMPQFSPDGARVAFVSDRAGTYELWIGQADGTRLRQVTSLGAAFIGYPRWSPDGSRLAFEVHRDGQVDVYVVDALGGTLHLLTDGEGSNLAPSWSLDGRFVYFGSNRTGIWQVWKIPAEGGVPVQVTPGGGYRAHEAPEGLYFTRYDQPGVWHQMPHGDVPGPIPGTEAVDAESNWGLYPDGLYVLAESGEVPILRLLDPMGQLQATYPLPALRTSYGVSLAPDRRAFLFTSAERDESDLMVVDGLHE